jgi:hypothetical protein
MVIYTEDATPKAIYFDNEGHVIRYTMASSTAKSITFLSDPVPDRPRYRLSYTALAGDRLGGEFAVAPVDAPETFKPMFLFEMRRAAPAR